MDMIAGNAHTRGRAYEAARLPDVVWGRVNGQSVVVSCDTLSIYVGTGQLRVWAPHNERHADIIYRSECAATTHEGLDAILKGGSKDLTSIDPVTLNVTRAQVPSLHC